MSRFKIGDRVVIKCGEYTGNTGRVTGFRVVDLLSSELVVMLDCLGNRFFTIVSISPEHLDDLEEDASLNLVNKTCNCDIMALMARGCKCGGV